MSNCVRRQLTFLPFWRSIRALKFCISLAIDLPLSSLFHLCFQCQRVSSLASYLAASLPSLSLLSKKCFRSRGNRSMATTPAMTRTTVSGTVRLEDATLRLLFFCTDAIRFLCFSVFSAPAQIYQPYSMTTTINNSLFLTVGPTTLAINLLICVVMCAVLSAAYLICSQ